MSDIRQSQNVRLNRAPASADTPADTSRTDDPTTTTDASGASRAQATTANGLRQPPAVQDAREARGIANNSTLAITGRGAEGTNTPATTPVARVTSGATDPNAGARSFVQNLQALDFKDSKDSDSMTAAFLKLESTNMSTNQSIEGYLNQAKHFLREAAFKIERALANANPDALLQQADQLEQQAAQMVQAAIQDSGQSGGKLDQLLQEMQSGDDGTGGVGGGSGMSDGVAREAWMHIYDSADRAIRESALASKAEQEALAKGDTVAAKAAHDRADAAESRARQMLSSGGIEVSEKDATEIGKLALEMEASGDKSNVMTKYLDLHPEKAQAMLPKEAYDAVKDKGGQAIVDAIMTYQGTQMDPMSMSSMGLAMNAADQQGINDIMGQFPEAAGMQGVLQGAADLLAQAYELRIRAYNMKEALLDAQNSIHEGKTDDGQFGVARRNAVAQDQIMRDFVRLTGGTRPDMQARADANIEARRARPQVVQLVQDLIDHDQRTQSIRRPNALRT